MNVVATARINKLKCKMCVMQQWQFETALTIGIKFLDFLILLIVADFLIRLKKFGKSPKNFNSFP